MPKIIDKAKENPLVTTIVGVMAVASAVNVGSVIQTVRYVDSLATKADVVAAAAAERQYAADQLAQHLDDAEESFRGLEGKIDRVRAFTEIVPELRNLLALRCMGTRNLDTIIDRLKDEYSDLTGEAYQEPACDRLLATR